MFMEALGLLSSSWLLDLSSATAFTWRVSSSVFQSTIKTWPTRKNYPHPDPEQRTLLLYVSRERFEDGWVEIDIQGSAYFLPPLCSLICSKTTRSLFQSGSGTSLASSSPKPPPICLGGAGRSMKAAILVVSESTTLLQLRVSLTY